MTGNQTPTEVVALSWPAQATEAADLARHGRPRLLLVDEDAEPPDVVDPLADWIRIPARASDIEARLRALACRVNPAAEIHLDPYGRLERRGRRVNISSPIERRIVALLLENIDQVMTFDQLLAGGWSDIDPRPNALRIHVARVNRKILVLGLRIRAIRRIGYVLEVDDKSSAVDPPARSLDPFVADDIVRHDEGERDDDSPFRPQHEWYVGPRG